MQYLRGRLFRTYKQLAILSNSKILRSARVLTFPRLIISHYETSLIVCGHIVRRNDCRMRNRPQMSHFPPSPRHFEYLDGRIGAQLRRIKQLVVQANEWPMVHK